MIPRPALVINIVPLDPDGLPIWAVMISNAVRVAWPADVDVPDWESIGLLIPSKVRVAVQAVIRRAIG